MSVRWQAILQLVTEVPSDPDVRYAPAPEHVLAEGRQDDCVDALLRNARYLQGQRPTRTGPSVIRALQATMDVGSTDGFIITDFGYRLILRRVER